VLNPLSAGRGLRLTVRRGGDVIAEFRRRSHDEPPFRGRDPLTSRPRPRRRHGLARILVAGLGTAPIRGYWRVESPLSARDPAVPRMPGTLPPRSSTWSPVPRGSGRGLPRARLTRHPALRGPLGPAGYREVSIYHHVTGQEEGCSGWALTVLLTRAVGPLRTGGPGAPCPRLSSAWTTVRGSVEVLEAESPLRPACCSGPLQYTRCSGPRCTLAGGPSTGSVADLVAAAQREWRHISTRPRCPHTALCCSGLSLDRRVVPADADGAKCPLPLDVLRLHFKFQW